MNYLFTSESVSEGHPDKVADQISDSILDEFLRQDPEAKVACETFCTAGLVVVGGEVASENAYVDIQKVVRDTISRIGYTKAEYGFDASSCGIISTIHEQSADIHRGVVREDEMSQGAGDQGMMFGYACKNTPDYMPLALYLSHKLLRVLADMRHSGEISYLRPDAKAQFSVEFDGQTNKPVRVHTIVLSTQHDEFDTDEAMQQRITTDVKEILIPRMLEGIRSERVRALFADANAITYYVNPTGKFVIGGPHGDTGLTGRKIIVDTYGGKGAHGGGAFSGKDPSKVDRSAAYAARHIAKNMVAAGVADEMLVQLSYAIGVAEPVSIYVNTYGKSHVNMTDGEIAEKIKDIFSLTPYAIEQRLKLRNPIYEETAAYGHMGREPRIVTKRFESLYRDTKEVTVELFTWEKLDYVEKIKAAFSL